MGSTSSVLNQYITNTETNQQVTNILTSTENDVSNVITLGNTINIINTATGVINCTPFNLVQTNQGNVTIATSINDTVSNNLASTLNNSLTQAGSQSNAILTQFLSNIGESTDTNLGQYLTSTIQNVVTNNCTTNTINRILGQFASSNSTTIVNSGTIEGGACNIFQSNIATYLSNQILSNIVTSISTNSVIQQVTQTSTQTATTTEQGVQGLISALFNGLTELSLAYIIGVVLLGGGVIWGASKIINVRIFAVIFVILAVYSILAYVLYLPPYTKYIPPTYYTCAKNAAGENNGGCVAIDTAQLNALPAPPQATSYNNLADCQKDIATGNACQQYWACVADTTSGLYTGAVKQCPNLIECPLSSQTAAQTACSNFTYKCNTTAVPASGTTKASTTYACQQINYDAVPNGEVVYQNPVQATALEQCTAACHA